MNKVKNMEKTNSKEAEDYMNELVVGPHLMMKYMKSINRRVNRIGKIIRIFEIDI